MIKTYKGGEVGSRVGLQLPSGQSKTETICLMIYSTCRMDAHRAASGRALAGVHEAWVSSPAPQERGKIKENSKANQLPGEA